MFPRDFKQDKQKEIYTHWKCIETKEYPNYPKVAKKEQVFTSIFKVLRDIIFSETLFQEER